MKILLVEDDAFFQKFYKFKLAEAGFEVFVGADGLQGLEVLKTQTPDIILLDLIMPNMDGFEFMENLAKLPDKKNIPVLVFSTLSQDQDVQRAKSLGAVDYCNKSFFDFDSLLLKIKSILKMN